MKILFVTVLALFAAQASYADFDCVPSRANETAGTIIGGIIGGVIGHQIGKGRGNDLATGAGAVIGALVGGSKGREVDAREQNLVCQAHRHYIVSNEVDYTWSESRWSGRVRYGRHGYYMGRDYRVPCREYERVRYEDGREVMRTSSTVCSYPDGSIREVQSSQVIFGDHPVVVPSQPVYRNDNRERRHDRGGDLMGFCRDFDHQEFYQAKNFAYSTNGINLSSSESVNWAQEYVNTHHCNTIEEYAQRFRALYSFAYNPSGLDMSPSDARSFALSKVEEVQVYEVERWKIQFSAAYRFFYDPSGLDLSPTDARNKAYDWVFKGYCEDAEGISSLRQAYAKEYSFAYSPSGLDMSPSNARNYAINKIRRYSRCGDLL